MKYSRLKAQCNPCKLLFTRKLGRLTQVKMDPSAQHSTAQPSNTSPGWWINHPKATGIIRLGFSDDEDEEQNIASPGTRIPLLRWRNNVTRDSVLSKQNKQRASLSSERVDVFNSSTSFFKYTHTCVCVSILLTRY